MKIEKKTKYEIEKKRKTMIQQNLLKFAQRLEIRKRLRIF